MTEESNEGMLLNMIPYKKIKLSRYQKGDYGWEISVSGNNMLEILTEIHDTNTELTRNYGTREQP